MCGILGVLGHRSKEWFQRSAELEPVLKHRGPDAFLTTLDETSSCFLAHWRLKIIDLSDDANQPMQSSCKRYTIVFNGEIYNYLELKKELVSTHHFLTKSDTEVLLAGYKQWGKSLLPKLKGMFSFAIWDNHTHELFAARDRFGVKPFYYYHKEQEFVFASEIKGVKKIVGKVSPNETTWSNYLKFGTYGNGVGTFHDKIFELPAGSCMTVFKGEVNVSKWYNFEDNVNQILDSDNVMQLFDEKINKAIQYRFRADVPLGINLSGGIDSSTLLALTAQLHHNIQGFTFYTGHEAYDELEWVERLVDGSHVTLNPVKLSAQEIPSLASHMTHIQDEPFGGIPTLAYGKVFEAARKKGVVVLLDGQGMDEQLGGYDYYYNDGQSIIQGSKSKATVPDAIQLVGNNTTERATAISNSSGLQEKQYQDLFHKKLPRALRFNDRVSMAASTELREPFLDEDLVAFCFGLPELYKKQDGKTKYLLRKYLSNKVPSFIFDVPKRPMQTPQREWLRNELKDWVHDQLALAKKTGWFNQTEMDKAIKAFYNEEVDNSFYIWQWVSVGLMQES
jgi:asparagine synthase (glutamine-hydrolysing)